MTRYVVEESEVKALRKAALNFGTESNMEAARILRVFQKKFYPESFKIFKITISDVIKDESDEI